MLGCYCVDLALDTAIVDALEFYGLEANPAAANRRPAPAATVEQHLERVAVAGKVLALVLRSVPVGRDDRRRIERLVYSACRRLEEVNRPPADRKYATAGVAAVVAYAAAGGGAIGTFKSFRRTFVSSAELLEPAVDPVVDRQDAQPAPIRDPHRRPIPPGSSAPAKTNPTRTIRSRRWSAGGKAVRK